MRRKHTFGAKCAQPSDTTGKLRCQRVHNLRDVFLVIRLNPPCDVRIVGGGFSSCCFFRSFSLYDPISSKVYGKVQAVTRLRGLMRTWMQNRNLTRSPVSFESN